MFRILVSICPDKPSKCLYALLRLSVTLRVMSGRESNLRSHSHEDIFLYLGCELWSPIRNDYLGHSVFCNDPFLEDFCRLFGVNFRGAWFQTDVFRELIYYDYDLDIAFFSG